MMVLSCESMNTNYMAKTEKLVVSVVTLQRIKGSRFKFHLVCDSCGSERNWKNGIRYNSKGRVERFLCRDCGRRFSEQSLKLTPVTSAVYQICVTQTKGAKNLVKVDRIKTRLVGATKNITDAGLKKSLFEFSWNLYRNGYADSTIETYTYLLKFFVKKGANLNNPDSVKDVIAKQETWSRGRKRNAVKAYSLYAKMHGLKWEKPRYQAIEKLPFIPTEQEIDSLTSGCSEQMTTFLQVLKETGARRGEAFNLKWTDIDFVSNTIRITPLKGSKPRIFKMSDKLAKMLNNLPRTSKRIWVYKLTFYLDKGFRRMRKRIAHKLGNPRLLRIHFHTLRHWKATTEYARTKDLLYVQQLLGHRSIKNTLKYVQLVNMPQDEKFICKVAKDAKEATELIELGFEYVTGEYNDGGKLFRKRKLSYLGSSSISAGSWSSMV